MKEGKFAARVENLAPSSIRQIMGVAKRLISEGRTVHELYIGQPDIKSIEIFQKAISEYVKKGHMNYSPFIGEQYLREAYARYLNHYFDRKGVQHLVVEPDNVTVTVGASQALTNTFLAICNPGDEVLCIEPFFPPYFGFLAVSGGVLKVVPTFAEKNFVLPPAKEIEKHITSRTKAILLNSPNNPSGKIFPAEEVTRLARLAAKRDLFLISDEVYREMILGDEDAFSVLQVQLDSTEMEVFKNRVIVIDSASKSFSLCGARIGFALARPEIIHRISRVNAHTVASVSDILQYAIAVTYDHVISDSSYFKELRKTYRERMEAAMEAAKKYLPEVIVPQPEGAFYIMMQFPEIEDISEYVLFMLEKFNLGNETVAVTPASSFYQTPGRGKNEIRLALVLDSEKIRRSIYIMSEAWKAFLAYQKQKKKPSLSAGGTKSQLTSNNFRTIV